MKKFIDNFILVFIMFIPFLYLYISYGIREHIDMSILGFVLISFFFLLAYIYLFINNIKRKMLIGYLIFMLLAIGLTFVNQVNSIESIKDILIMLYFPMFVFFFINYDNKWVNQKYISYVYLIFAFILTISYIFRFNADLAFEYKKGFIGLFYGSNIISPIIAVLMPIALDYASKSKNYIIKGLFYICTIITVLFIGTKTIYASLIVYVVYCLLKYFKRKPHIALMIATLASAVIIILPVIPQYQNYRTEKIYNAFSDDTTFYDIENVDKYLFSYKLKDTKIKVEDIKNENKMYSFIFGNKYEKVGIDLVDMILSIGIVGVILYIAFMIYILSSSKIKGIHLVLFVMMIFASFFQGNIFTNYLVYIFIALLFLLSKNQDDRTKILVVSNMYPNKNNKSYGIFVKNVEDRLSLYYNVDRVAIGKHNNIIAKLCAYIYLHLATIIKITFNNYDYVYIHFISHSSGGAVFASKFCKGTKLVFNAHGNDVVADTERDKKNIKKSAKYLKNAYKVVVPSSHYMNVIRENYNVPDNKIIIYPSGGVDTNLFRKIDKDEAKEYLKLDKKTKYIGYVSRVETDKGYDTFVEAINILSNDKKYKNYKYIILGGGSEEKILNKLITDYKLEDKIIMLNGLSREELVYLYNSLELFVFPTKRKSESLGLVGLEAFACKTLTITSNNEGPLSYAENKRNAYVFKQGDATDLVDKINTILDLDEKGKEKLIKNAYNKALEYDSSKMDNILKKIFK